MAKIYESEEILQRKNRIVKFLRGETGRPLVYLCPMGSMAKRQTGGAYGFSKRDFETWDVLLGIQRQMVDSLLETDNDNIPYLWPYTAGPHFTASLFGCRVEMSDDGVFWPEPPRFDFEKDALPQPDLSCPTMQRTIEEINFLQEHSDYSLSVALPDSSSPVNVAGDVLGMEQFLTQTALNPEKIREFALIVAEAIVLSMQKLSEQVKTEPVYSDRKSWLPQQYKMLPLCGTQMISPTSYENLFREADERILQQFDGGIAHICGKSTHLIPVLRDMTTVKGVELQGLPGGGYNPADDYQKYLDGLRDDQILILYSKGLDVEKILETTGGRRIIFRVTDPAEAVKIRSWCESRQ